MAAGQETSRRESVESADPAEPPIQAVPVVQVKPSKQDVEKQQATESRRTTFESDRRPDLTQVHSHVSTHDIAGFHHHEAGDEVYDRFPHHRKIIIVCILSFCSFLAPISSTAILAAVPEVAATYNSTGTIINLSNAIYQLFMGLSPMFWGPLGQVYGRYWTQLSSAILFTVFSIGTALAPNLVSFYVFRALTAFQGTSFLIIGASCIGDIYRPVDRATALSWFLSGTLIGPAFGPFIGMFGYCLCHCVGPC